MGVLRGRPRLPWRRVRSGVARVALALAVLGSAASGAATGQGQEEADVRASFERVFADFPRAFWRATDGWMRSMDMSPVGDPEEFARQHSLVDRSFVPVEGRPGRWVARARLVDPSLASEYWVFEFEYAEGRWRTLTGIRQLQDTELDLYEADRFTTSMRPFVELELEGLQAGPANADAHADAGEEPSPAAIDQRLLGSWTPVETVAPGAGPGEKGALGFAAWEFEPGVTRVGNGVESVEFPYRVQPETEPARIDHASSLGGAHILIRGVYRFTQDGLLEIVQNLHPGLPYPPLARPEAGESFVMLRLRRMTPAEEEALAEGPVPLDVRPYLDGLLEMGVRVDTDPKGRIRTVMMSHSRVTDADLVDLPRLGAFTALSLLGTGITDEGLRHVGRLTSLERLQLGLSGIGDAGLAALSPLRDLRQLSLMGTPITDASVPVLGTMKQLRELNVSGTRVSAAGVAELRRLLPDCAVLE